MPDFRQATLLLDETFGPGAGPATASVPGRVNLIGEHIDYHSLPVLPMAIQRRVRIAFRPAAGRRIRAVSNGYGVREFDWTHKLEPSAAGDWVNYVKAAAQAVEGRWQLSRGIDAALISDLPPAAGLSSSSAVLTAFTLALLKANGVQATFEELMGILPEGEYFVGTRGGGMDHAAVLAAEPGSALWIHFAPVSACSVPIPAGWSFLVAHSLTTAEKSGEVREEYNRRRTAGTRALERLGLGSFAAAVKSRSFDELKALAETSLEGEEQRCFLHVTGEAFRVNAAVAALRDGDAGLFAQALNASHESLRYLLRVSCPALDSLVETARESGALGARLTGAGFGGCAVIFCESTRRDEVARLLVDRYYSRHSEFDPDKHLIRAEASAGALSA